MFFCIKYLDETAIEPWLRSVLDIPSPHWRAQVMVWFVGAHDILTSAVRWPSEFSLEAHPYIGWEWSHCLRWELASTDDSGASPTTHFIAEGNQATVLRVLKSHFTEDRFLEWLDSISAVSYLADEMGEIPSTFETLYVLSTAARV